MAYVKGSVIQFLLSQVRTATAALINGKVYFYNPGTTSTTGVEIWTDEAATSAANNPYTLDANATAQLYGSGKYRIVIKDAAGVTQFDRDNVMFYDFDIPYEYDALQYGAGTFTQATIAAALTAIGMTNKTTLLLRPGTWVISSTFDISAYTNVTFKIVSGAKLSGAFTATFPPKNIEAGLYQIFDSTITVVGLGVAYPEWFGTPSTATVQLACNAIITSLAWTMGGTVYISPGSVWTPSAISFPDHVTIVDLEGGYPTIYTGNTDGGFHIVGPGANGSPHLALHNLKNDGVRSTGFVMRNGASPISDPRNQWFLISGLNGNVTDDIYEDYLTIAAYQGQYYATGTVDVTSGSATVVGTSTLWTPTVGVHVGANFRVGDVQGVVKSVESATSLTLESVWSGATLAGQTYTMKGGGALGGSPPALESGKGKYQSRLILAPDGTFIINPSSASLVQYDPITAEAAGYTAVINKRGGKESANHIILLATSTAERVGFDLQAGDTASRKRIVVDHDTNTLAVYAANLTTPLLKIGNTGATFIASPASNGIAGAWTAEPTTTSTVVSNAAVTANSIVVVTAANAVAAGLTGVYTDVAENVAGVSFTVHHGDPGGGNHGFFNYVMIN
jgi:hypothetical protein